MFNSEKLEKYREHYNNYPHPKCQRLLSVVGNTCALNMWQEQSLIWFPGYKR